MEIELPKGINFTILMDILRKNISQISSILPPDIAAQLIQKLNGSLPVNVHVNDSSRTYIRHSTYHDPELSYRMNLIRAYGVITMIASIVGMLGNGLVMTVYMKKLKDLSVVKLLILHLAVADFVFSISQSVLALPSIQLSGWEFGEPACKLIHSCLLLGSLIAVGTMLIIAVERYYSIVRALTYTNQRRRVIILVIIIWLAACASTAPSTLALQLHVKDKSCAERWTESGLSRTGEIFYEFYLLVIWFLVPMAVISFSYFSIINLLKQPLEKRGLSVWNVSPKYFLRRRKEDMKAVRTSVAVVFAFFICCFPLRVLWVITKFVNLKSLPEKSYVALLYAGLLPYPLHVAANPLIYSLIDKLFRKDVRNLFGIHRRKRLQTLIAKDTNGHRLSLTGKSVCPTSLDASPEEETRLRSLSLLCKN